MTTETSPNLEVESEAGGEVGNSLVEALRRNVQFRNAVRQVVREELGLKSPCDRPAGLPPSEMDAVMADLEALRREIALAPDVVDDLLEEHRREFGRG